LKQVVVGVITYKRPSWLKRLVSELIKQNTDGIKCSILVVDNADDPATKSVVDSFCVPENAMPVTYKVEPVRGIVAARNRVVSEFLLLDADFLAFIDDDEWPENDDWLKKLVTKALISETDVVTSHVVSVDERLGKNWATEILYPQNHREEGQYLTTFYTNNLLLSRHLLEAMHPCFDERFAMTGASDYHFALKCQFKGFKCIYTNAPVIEEFPDSRANIRWFCRRGFRSGIGYTRSHLFEEPIGKVLIKCSALSLVRFLRGGGLILKSLLTMNKATFVDGLFRICSSAGTIAGFFGIKHNEYQHTHGR
jgi:succinoglycan biosynthesis protein ExoM